MTTMDATTIMRIALTRGSFVTLHFLKTEAAANAVADKLLVELRKTPRHAKAERSKIRVKASEMYPGTWDVRFMVGIPLPIMSRKSSNTANIATNKARVDAVMAAFRASFTAKDLVSSYKFPR